MSSAPTIYNLALLSRFAVGTCFSLKSDLKFKVSKRVLEMQEKDSRAKKGVLRSRQGLLLSIFFFWLSFAFVCFHGRAMYIYGFKAVTLRFQFAEALVTRAARA